LNVTTEAPAGTLATDLARGDVLLNKQGKPHARVTGTREHHNPRKVIVFTKTLGRGVSTYKVFDRDVTVPVAR